MKLVMSPITKKRNEINMIKLVEFKTAIELALPVIFDEG